MNAFMKAKEKARKSGKNLFLTMEILTWVLKPKRV